MRTRWLILALVAIPGCEFESYSGPPRAAPGPAPGAAPGSPPGAPPAGEPGRAPASPPPAAGGCAAGSVCFRITPGAPGALGPSRLVLLWTAPGDDEAVPPEISNLATLTGKETNVVLPLASVPRPRNTIRMGQAWGYVFVVPATEPNQANPKQATGAPNMMFVHVVGAAAQSGLMRDKFPNGMAEGTAPYFMQKRSVHDGFVLAQPGSVFDLRICPVNAPSCEIPFPNPS